MNNKEIDMQIFITILCIALLQLEHAATPAYAQTDEEIARASKCMGEPQSKTNTLSFFGGYYEKKHQYDKANEYNKKLLALFEQQWGKDYVKTAWAMSKIAKCYSLDGKDSLAEPYYKNSWNILQKITFADPEFLQFETDALNTCLSYFKSTNQMATSQAIDVRLKKLTSGQLKMAPATITAN